MQSQWRRFLYLFLLSVAGLVGSVWTLWMQLPILSISDNALHSNSDAINAQERGRLRREYKGKRLFQDYESPPQLQREKATASVCQKWAVLTTLVEEDDPSLLQRLQESKPSHDWCIALVTSTEMHEKFHGMAIDDHLHVISLELMKERDDATLGDFVAAMQASSNAESAFRNVGYLYALKQGARYILDLDIAADMKELWGNLDDTYFASPEMMVEVPLVGDVKTLNPHAYIFNETALGTSWPRGYPKVHDHPRQSAKIALTKSIPRDRIGVVQQLSRIPDLDAQGLLMVGDVATPTQQEDSSKKRNALLVPSHTSVPYNTKATLHTPEALWAALLPTSLDPRISDIWRSYFAQTLFHSMQLQVIVAHPPSVQKSSNDNRIPPATEAQLKSDMVHYTRGPALLDALEEHRIATMDAAKDSLPKRMEDLWIHLYEQGFLDLQDITSMQLWLQALNSLFSFPKPQPRPYFQNVVLMGQFNYASYTKHVKTNLRSKGLEQLAQRLFHAGDIAFDESSQELDLTIQEDAVESVAFWVQKMREVFQHVVVRGPFSRQQVSDLRLLYGIEAHGVDNSRWKHTLQDQGHYSPISNLLQTLEEYKDLPGIDGVMYVHDDMFLDISNLIQAQASDNASLSKFPDAAILATGQGTRESYFDPRTSVDKDSISRRTYTIDSGGRISNLNGQHFGSDQNALMQSLEYWPWNPGHCIPRLVELAQDPRIDPFRMKQGEYAGSILIPPWEPSDFLFVPTHLADLFIELATLFLDHRVFLECALPTIVDMLRQNAGAEVQTSNICTSWDESSRNTDAMVEACHRDARTQADATRPRQSYGLYHPYKLSNGMKSWDAMFDLVTFSGIQS